MYFQVELVVKKLYLIIIVKIDLNEFMVWLAYAKKGNQPSVFSNRTDESSATQYFQVTHIMF